MATTGISQSQWRSRPRPVGNIRPGTRCTRRDSFEFGPPPGVALSAANNDAAPPLRFSPPIAGGCARDRYKRRLMAGFLANISQAGLHGSDYREEVCLWASITACIVRFQKGFLLWK